MKLSLFVTLILLTFSAFAQSIRPHDNVGRFVRERDQRLREAQRDVDRAHAQRVSEANRFCRNLRGTSYQAFIKSIRCGDGDLTLEILNRNPDFVNRKSDWKSPLYISLMENVVPNDNGYNTKKYRVVKILIDNGADLNEVVVDNENGISNPISYYVRYWGGQ